MLSYDDIQKLIDQYEDALDAAGVDPVNLWPADYADRYGLPVMPRALEALYDERDAAEMP